MFTVTNHLNGLLSIDGPGVHHVIPLAELRTIRVLGTGVLTKQDSAIFIFSIDDSFTVQCNNSSAIIDLVESVKVHWNNYKSSLHQFENSIQNPVVISGRANSVVIQWGVNTVPVTLSEIMYS